LNNFKISKFIYAVSTLSGTIIGVGLFGLPYVTLKVGLWVILAYFLILGILVVLVHQFFGELALRTPDFKRLPGFAKIYLGNWGEKTAFVSTILGLFGALLSYLIVGGEFFTELLSPYIGGNDLIYTLLYFTIGSILIFYGIKAVAKVEFWGLILFFIILIIIFFSGRNLINTQNLFIGAKDFPNLVQNLFLPYGVILFSLWGAALIPEVEEMLGENKKMLKVIIPLSILIPTLVYLAFIYLILGVAGTKTSESALLSLNDFFGNGIVVLALFFGLLTTFTSFITLGLTLKKIFWYDLKITKNLSWAITCFFPLILFLIGLKSFITVIGFVGGVMLAVDGILILLMYNKIRPERKFITYSLISLFLAGIVYSLLYFS
jgi:tyrosine-specific transport protein